MINKNLVSIIVTTKNEELVIGRLLESIKAQTHKGIEVVVIDNNSSDKTKVIARHFTDKVFNLGPERSAQRNFGAKKARGSYLFILDADMELTENVVKECVDLAQSDKSIGGIVVPEQSIANSFWERVKAHERSFYNEGGDNLTDSARFFPKKVFWEIGGYDETITGPEDWDLPESIRKNGLQIRRVKSLIYHYERVSSPIQLAKKKYYYALRTYRYLEKHKVGVISPKTIYFLRPIFYKKWRRLLSNPVLSVAMFLMFFLELSGGGLGYITGRIKKL